MDRNHCCSSVIIYNFYLIGIAAFEAKANAPRPIDRDRPLASSALERVQADALERADVIQSFGRVQDCQQLQRRFGIETAKSGLAGFEKSTRRRIAPRADHLVSLQRFTWYVKRIGGHGREQTLVQQRLRSQHRCWWTR